ncbi:MAG TPA: ABATE domain-containing protein [Ktedonobacterales bacterium]
MTILPAEAQNGEDSGALAHVEPLCLLFANTVDFHASAQPQEGLARHDDLVRWGGIVGLLTAPEAERMRQAAALQPRVAQAALARAIALREAIYRLFAASIHDQPAAQADLDILNAALAAPDGRRLTQDGADIVWGWPEPRLETWPLLAVGWSAAELLTSADRDRVGQCADERGCGWLFLDTSRNHSRRWCSMGDCGNRAKQRRHTQRHSGRAEV